VLRRQHHPGIRGPGGRLDQDASFPVGDASFPAHAIFNLGISGDTAESLAGRMVATARRIADQLLLVGLLADRIGEQLRRWL
jgi:hypothetical protein